MSRICSPIDVATTTLVYDAIPPLVFASTGFPALCSSVSICTQRRIRGEDGRDANLRGRNVVAEIDASES